MPKPQAKPARATKPPLDWPAVLRTGEAGVRKWNRARADDLYAVDFTGANLSDCDLTGAKLFGAQADRASFARSKLGVVLTGAQLAGADFTSADLTRADLTYVTAPKAVFTGANLTYADLWGANLAGASFSGATLTGTKLPDADLRGTDFTGTDLSEAHLEGAKFDRDTKWPAGYVIPAELTWAGRGTDPRLSGKGKKAVAADINGLMARLNALIDPKRMKRTLDMLKAGKNQLFAEIEPAVVRGVVRSQTEEDLVYSCVLTDAGVYACCMPDLQLCMGLRGEPCKHLLVLLIGLARAGELDPTTIDKWVMAAAGQNHKWNKTTRNHVSDTLLKYKGVQAGEIDWRPTETIPEDFYAM
jgi:Pentapeptide repeats (8 copies)